MSSSLVSWSANFLVSVVICLIFYGVIQLVNLIFARLSENLTQDRLNVLNLLRRICNAIIIIICTIAVLEKWGIDVRALIAGLGLTGFALGFAMRDMLASGLAGILIILYRPFKIGDEIGILGLERQVVKIDMKHTTIIDQNKRHLIPNSKILSETITVIK